MSLRGTFRRPFPEQVAAFRLRLGNLVPTRAWDDIQRAQHDRAFMVAGAMKADLLADLARAVDRAIAEGTSLEEFRRDFREAVERNDWNGWTGQGTKAGEAWRTRVIYRTNARVSYAAGRYAQLQRFPFWIYRHGGSAEPRLQHLSWNGLVLERGHPFWAVAYPPNGWGCSCYVTGARSRDAAKDRGGDPSKELQPGWDALQPRTGTPKGIGKGWDYAPGATVAGELTDTLKALAGKLPKLPAMIGAAMFQNMPPAARRALDEEFKEFLEAALVEQVQQRFMVVGALQPAWVRAAKDRGVHIESAEIAITDKSIQHTFRGTPHVKVAGTRPTGRQPKADPLDLEWFADLPKHLRAPRAVLLDQTERHPVFVLVYDVPGSKAKLVVRINAPIKKSSDVMNAVTTGRLVTAVDLDAEIRRGVDLIEGEL